MAVQNVQRERAAPDEFEEVRAFLAERGVFPDEQGTYREEDIPAIEAAVRSRGWNPLLKGMTGNWEVEIEEKRGPSQSQVAVSGAPDRLTALLRTLRIALTWLSPEEEAALFDEEARQTIGLSSEDFMQKWHAGHLNLDDPRVIFLLRRRPLGW